MARFTVRDVAVVPFPFSDNPAVSKPRPALILAVLPGEDLILCVITSQAPRLNDTTLTSNDFEFGGLLRPSTIRPTQLFTISRRYVSNPVGRIKVEKLREVSSILRTILPLA